MSTGGAGKYRLDRRLGGGGMAEVYAGHAVGAEGFSRPIAIKRVLPGHSDHAGFAAMFVAEAQLSARLIHPNIVSVLDFDRDPDGRLFLVMELIDGKDLGALIATGRLPLPVVIFVIAEVLRGLGFAHDLPTGTGPSGVVHRDVSPHNVLLSWTGEVKVSDFGIAKARAASEATASAFIKGKPAYMSPEQANGERLDGRSDLFAVGVMLWEMLVDQRLFVAEDTRATLAAVLFGPIPRPRLLRPDLPKDLERVVMKLLERDLPARYATAEHARAELLACGDAPRDGREALRDLLSQRFPDLAPVRHSRAHVLDNSRHIRHARPAPADVPGLATQMSAATSTMKPARPLRLAQVVIVLAALVASAVVGFTLVAAARRPDAVTHLPSSPPTQP
jgi:serine/threonine protein kinase